MRILQFLFCSTQHGWLRRHRVLARTVILQTDTQTSPLSPGIPASLSSFISSDLSSPYCAQPTNNVLSRQVILLFSDPYYISPCLARFLPFLLFFTLHASLLADSSFARFQLRLTSSRKSSQKYSPTPTVGEEPPLCAPRALCCPSPGTYYTTLWLPV